MARTPTPAAAANSTARTTPPVADPVATPTAPALPEASNEASSVDLFEARVLIATGDLAVNDVLRADSDTIEALRVAGVVDSDPAAVAYAHSLAG